MLWKEGRISDLMHECRVIQKRLLKIQKNVNLKTLLERVFSNLMIQGKIKAALNFLSKEGDSGVLDMNDNVCNELQNKHPDPGPISENTLSNGPFENIPISYFDLIDENMIQKAALQTKGAGGPSQLDADQYHQNTKRKEKIFEKKYLNLQKN